VTIHVLCWVGLLYFLCKAVYDFVQRPTNVNLINAPIEITGLILPITSIYNQKNVKKTKTKDFLSLYCYSVKPTLKYTCTVVVTIINKCKIDNGVWGFTLTTMGKSGLLLCFSKFKLDQVTFGIVFV
jgi:hypothetical protein